MLHTTISHNTYSQNNTENDFLKQQTKALLYLPAYSCLAVPQMGPGAFTPVAPKITIMARFPSIFPCFFRESFSESHFEVPNLFQKQGFVLFLLLKSSKLIFPVPGRRYLKNKDLLYFYYTFPNFRSLKLRLRQPR